MKGTVGRERLWGIEVGEGWAPLGNLLEEAGHERTYPRTKSAEEFQARLQ